VPRLRPRVREIQVIRGDGSVRDETCDDAPRVAGDHTHVREPALGGTRGDRGRGAPGPLDPEEVDAREGAGEGEQDVATPGSDLHLAGPVVPEAAAPRDGRRRLLRVPTSGSPPHRRPVFRAGRAVPSFSAARNPSTGRVFSTSSAVAQPRRAWSMPKRRGKARWRTSCASESITIGTPAATACRTGSARRSSPSP